LFAELKHDLGLTTGCFPRKLLLNAHKFEGAATFGLWQLAKSNKCQSEASHSPTS